MAEGRELGWDDYVQEDGKEFIILPEGDYDFTIEKFERSRTDGKGKLPPCNKAIVYFTIHNPHGEDVTVIEHFVLHTSLEWKISELFCSIGQKQKGEKVQMKWQTIPGSKGRCKLIINEYEKDGETRKSNRIKTFYPMEPKKFTPGSF